MPLENDTIFSAADINNGQSESGMQQNAVQSSSAVDAATNYSNNKSNGPTNRARIQTHHISGR
jgi:hypothetical protein